MLFLLYVKALILSNLHFVVNHMQTWTMRYKGTLLHLLKMIKPRVVDQNAHIQSQIWNYEELPQLITSLQGSHARVFRSMNVVVSAHSIPSIGTLTKAKTKAQVWLELDSYFDELMCITTSANLAISADTMHQYVTRSASLKTMLCMLLGELDRGARAVYLDVIEARLCLQKDVTTEYTDNIADYRAWHQFTTVDYHEDVDELVFPQSSEP